jgi:hypothetical protein
LAGTGEEIQGGVELALAAHAFSFCPFFVAWTKKGQIVVLS